MFGLNDLSNALNGAVTSNQANNPQTLASQIYAALAHWLSGSIYPVLMGILIFVVVLFIFYGAFLYFTAYGDEARATQAKKTITYAIVGLIIALLSFAIVTFVKGILVRRNQSQQQNIQVPTGAGNENPFEQAPGY